MRWRMHIKISGSLRFSAIFSATEPVFCWLWCISGATPTSCKTRRLNEDSVSMLNNNVNHSLVVLILLFFMLLVGLDPRKGLTRIRLYSEVEYVILTSRNVFSQLFHSPLAEISNPALSVVFYSLSKSFLLIGRCVGSVWTFHSRQVLSFHTEFKNILPHR